MDVAALTSTPPRNEAWEQLTALVDRRAQLLAHTDGLEREQRKSSQAATAAADAVADVERRTLAGESVADGERKRLEGALVKARARAAEPWSERRAGAGRAVADHDQAIQRYIASTYDALHDGLRQEGDLAARAVDEAAAALVEAYRRWEDVLSRMTALSATIRPPRPGDWVRARGDVAAREAQRLVEQGGERQPDIRDPRAPRSAAEEVPA